MVDLVEKRARFERVRSDLLRRVVVAEPAHHDVGRTPDVRVRSGSERHPSRPTADPFCETTTGSNSTINPLHDFAFGWR